MAEKKSNQQEKKERLTFFIDPSLRAEYEQLAKVDHRDLGDIIRIALELAKPLMDSPRPGSGSVVSRVVSPKILLRVELL